MHCYINDSHLFLLTQKYDMYYGTRNELNQFHIQAFIGTHETIKLLSASRENRTIHLTRLGENEIKVEDNESQTQSLQLLNDARLIDDILLVGNDSIHLTLHPLKPFWQKEFFVKSPDDLQVLVLSSYYYDTHNFEVFLRNGNQGLFLQLDPPINVSRYRDGGCIIKLKDMTCDFRVEGPHVLIMNETKFSCETVKDSMTCHLMMRDLTQTEFENIV
jgi:hypothetical protein